MYNELNIDLLKQGLLTIAQIGDVKEAVSSTHGVKYVIDGLLQTQTGEAVKVRTIWIIDKGQTRPRFVTTYPV